MRARIWEQFTVEEFQQVREETRTVLLPLGVCDQHGFHMPLSVDMHNAEQIRRRGSEETGERIAEECVRALVELVRRMEAAG